MVSMKSAWQPECTNAKSGVVVLANPEANAQTPAAPSSVFIAS